MVFENGVLRRIFRPKRGEVIGRWRNMRRFILYMLERILLGS
jgi:hypothetical protein